MKNTTQLQVVKKKEGKKMTEANTGNLDVDLGQLYLFIYIRGPQSLEPWPITGP